jgi:hypothetical protein
MQTLSMGVSRGLEVTCRFEPARSGVVWIGPICVVVGMEFEQCHVAFFKCSALEASILSKKDATAEVGVDDGGDGLWPARSILTFRLRACFADRQLESGAEFET